MGQERDFGLGSVKSSLLSYTFETCMVCEPMPPNKFNFFKRGDSGYHCRLALRRVPIGFPNRDPRGLARVSKGKTSADVQGVWREVGKSASAVI